MIRRLLVVLVLGTGTGALLGLVARLPMRLVAIARVEGTDFTIGGTLGIALVFAIAAAGAAVAGVLRWPWWGVLPIIVVTSGPMALSGTGIGVGEVSGAFDDQLTTGRLVVVIALTVVIALLAVAAPWVGYRLGRSRDDQPGARQPATRPA